jgi:hypothetical protein
MIKNTFARYLTMLAVGGSILGGAAIGLAGMAGAATVTPPAGPGYSYAPTVKAHSAPTQMPGAHNHHGVWHIQSRAK